MAWSHDKMEGKKTYSQTFHRTLETQTEGGLFISDMQRSLKKKKSQKSFINALGKATAFKITQVIF